MDKKHFSFFDNSELGKALSASKQAFIYVGFFSLFVNLLLLVPSFYMMAVYDKVMVSGSESTLLMLSLITLFLFLVMGGLEWIRSQILIATSAKLDGLLGGRVFDSVFAQSLVNRGAAGAQAMQDLLQLRQFLTGPGVFAFFDAPWMPIYIILMFLFHWSFGVVAILAGITLASLAIWNELSTRDDMADASKKAIEVSQFTQRNLRNAEVIEVMGMMPRLRERWRQKQETVLGLQGHASAKAGLISSLVKVVRLTIQSLVLGLGAFLAIHKQISPGLVIAGSILMGRALGPLDLMISTWRGFLATRESYKRLASLLDDFPQRDEAMPLPVIKGEIRVDQLIVVPPGAALPVLKNLSFHLEAGQLMAIIGPSAAGKSTLVRALLGIYRPTKGAVRLDGCEIQNWNRQQLGDCVGYLPQDVELLDGSINENIARFNQLDPAKVVAAAQMACVHEIILGLPQGYDSHVLGNGHSLSAGQQQRLGLARALYGNPQLIVLDEPNSNLDQAGDQALFESLVLLKKLGKTVIVVTHRNNLLSLADKVLLLVDGQIGGFGPRDEILAGLAKSQQLPKA